MNIWDIIITAVLVGAVVLAVILTRKRKKTGCCGNSGSECHCNDKSRCEGCRYK